MSLLDLKNATVRVAFTFVVVLGIQGALAGEGHRHEGDFIIGIDGNGQLTLEADLDENNSLPAVSGLLNGWAADEPGFEALEEDEPAEDFFTLGAGANVSVEVISISPAFQAWTPGFSDVLDSTGDQWVLGGPALHEHATWHINSDAPEFDSKQVKWFFSFRLIDTGMTGYAPSQIYTVGFTNVDPNAPIPTMSEWGMVVMGLLLVTAGVLCHGRRIATVG